jgi:MoCo/4Fe-4S cofactor protein with predicted Tat translocation signal
MSVHDQCPSSKQAGLPGKAELADRRRELPRLAGRTGRKYWRSVEEFADTPEFREALEREFPAGASELLETSRRSFLQLMGASLALAGLATIPGCRRPDHKILPYAKDVPEDVIPGKPLFYATCMPLPGGGAEGLLVETHEGRPTKVEGNPLHPLNRGKSSAWAQASILGLYDPDRLMFPVYHPRGEDERPASFDDFGAWSKEHFARFDATKGAGLAFLVEKKSSPSRDALRDRVLKRWPKAEWVPYEAYDPRGAIEGGRLAFGVPVREQLDFGQADVILSLDRDFLGDEPAGLANARGFAATRRVMTTKDSMSRLYVAESMFTLTGGKADHRVRLSPSRITALAVEVAKAVLEKVRGPHPELSAAVEAVVVPDAAVLDRAWIEAVAEDLVSEEAEGSRRTRVGRSMILAGASQPPEVHALVHALNAVLGNAGRTVRYLSMPADLSADSAAGIAGVSQGLKEGRISTLVVLGCNPVFTAPADTGFAGAYAKATTICLSVENSETALASTWSLNGATYFESWGDAEAWDGTVGPIQPVIAPLYEGASDLEVLATILGDEKADGHEIVRGVWGSLGLPDFEKAWNRSLHDGVLPSRGSSAGAMEVKFAAVADAVRKLSVPAGPSDGALEVVFAVGRVHDGRFANYGWLQELPQPATTVVWDNPALVSPATARALGVTPVGYSPENPSGMYTKPKYPEAAMAMVTVNGRSMELPIWIVPGMADHTVVLQLGYGRRVSGKVGEGVGFDTYGLRDAASSSTARGGTIKAGNTTYMVASTQTHWSLEGRTSIVRAVDLPAWRKHGDAPPKTEADRLYGKVKTLNFGEQVSGGELNHAPPTESLYVNPLNQSRAEAAAGSAYSKRQQWGMTIDLATCTGCGACTAACQAENNIPIVGKKEVAKGREMTWIRVDRYYTGENVESPEEMLHQPVACVHCENAPCETVCPVNATVHGPEGINYMTYNRCIGTRYCANNCPYKVRRFNFFDYGVLKFKGSYFGEDVMPYWGKRNPNLVPPRLRQKLDEISKMQKNPDVTVRSRGVMEKCSYCIQRINQSRIEVKLHDLSVIPDGFFQTACQQACPSDAIVFGDILDTDTAYTGADGATRTGSRVYATRNHPRAYALLGYLNTRPRTSYLVAVRNPNPRLRKPEEDPFGHHGGDVHEGDHATTYRRDAGAAAEDRGYALSLRVLGGGVQA